MQQDQKMTNYQKYLEQRQKISAINSTIALLHWDQGIYMPTKGAAFRSRQLATLSGISHDLQTSDDYGALLKLLSSDITLSDIEAKNIALSQKDNVSSSLCDRVTMFFLLHRHRETLSRSQGTLSPCRGETMWLLRQIGTA